MRVAIYPRVWTANNSENPGMQLRELREYCQHRGWAPAGEDVDTGISGAKGSRPEFNRRVADAHKLRFDAIVVWKFDRESNSLLAV